MDAGSAPARSVIRLLGVPFRPVSMPSLMLHLGRWIENRTGAYVCAVCASSLVDASRDPRFLDALVHSDVNLPDGAPVAWALSALMGSRQERLAGPSVMEEVLHQAHERGYRVALYGSTPEIQAAVVERIERECPSATVALALSPPFRTLGRDEEDALVEDLRASRPDLVLVSLGAPKQEIWMHRHAAQLGVPAIGVGAAFEYHTGAIRRAPPCMQRMGFEWSYRLMQQPRRMAYRFGRTLPVFAWRASLQIVSHRLRGLVSRRENRRIA